jgi:hypothetical protein
VKCFSARFSGLGILSRGLKPPGGYGNELQNAFDHKKHLHLLQAFLSTLPDGLVETGEGLSFAFALTD